MMRQCSIADARNSLPSIVREAERGSPVELTRRGKRVAVLLSADEYERLKPPTADLWSAVEQFRAGRDLSAIDAAEVYADVRDRSPGRAVDL